MAFEGSTPMPFLCMVSNHEQVLDVGQIGEARATAPRCLPICDQQDQTIGHLLVECVLAREVWARIFAAFNMPAGAPQAGETLQDWCTRHGSLGRNAKMIRIVCLLTLWELWKHRNVIVFDGVNVSVTRLMERIGSESRAWMQAGILRGDLAAAFIGAPEWAHCE